MNKKGFIRLIKIIVILIGMSVSAFVAALIFQQYRAKIDGKFEPNAVAIFDLVLPAVTIQNWLIVLVFVGSLVAVVITSIDMRNHPVRFLASMIVFMVATGIIAPAASNMFDGLMNKTDLQQFESLYFTETSYLMKNLPFFIAIGGIIVGITLYSKFVLGGGAS